jgi:alpha-ketoglutarate-dependent taurine dioxygenase
LRALGAYREWRARKLAAYPRDATDLVVQIRDPHQVSRAEKSALRQRIDAANMAVFALAQPLDKAAFAGFCAQFGLRRLDRNLCADDDGISALCVVPEGRAREYIPYSNKPINWHTDGYYNAPDQMIRAMVLHCVQPAASGGANALLDHEMVYIHLRDLNPDYIAALMHPQCMTIPPNVEKGVEIRPAQTGPVFSLSPSDGSLHMRYTARTRSIAWRDDALTRAAVAALEGLLNSDSPLILNHRMQAGQGVLCNNVLHTRTGFVDDATTGEERLVLRARYYDRIHFEATTT